MTRSSSTVLPTRISTAGTARSYWPRPRTWRPEPGWSSITPEERQMAKPCNFGLLYRMGNRGFYNYMRAGYQPNITYAEACDLRAQFFEGYPDLAVWQDDYSRHSRQQRASRKRYAGGAGAGNGKRRPRMIPTRTQTFYADKLIGFNGAYAINHPVQGSSAEVMMIALTRLDKALRDEPAQLIATVHDEAVLLVPDDCGCGGTHRCRRSEGDDRRLP